MRLPVLFFHKHSQRLCIPHPLLPLSSSCILLLVVSWNGPPVPSTCTATDLVRPASFQSTPSGEILILRQVLRRIYRKSAIN